MDTLNEILLQDTYATYMDVLNKDASLSEVVDKIFQPLFTAKQTGEEIGLGLSLSYDIIKINGGEIRLETTEVTGNGFKINFFFQA